MVYTEGQSHCDAKHWCTHCWFETKRFYVQYYLEFLVCFENMRCHV